MTGDQSHGKMTHTIDKLLACSGYPKGTIVINYQMPSGTRNGKSFTGTSRIAYLPDTPEGREVF
jgi:deltex-like protein